MVERAAVEKVVKLLEKAASTEFDAEASALIERACSMMGSMNDQPPEHGISVSSTDNVDRYEHADETDQSTIDCWA